MTRLVRAPNPGPMTLEGTNTWLVGRARVLVVDPGPHDDGHLRAVLAETARDGGVLGGVLLTHRHTDHAEALASSLLRDALEAAGAPVLALDPSLGTRPTEDGLAGATDEPLRLLPVPGHTDDSLALVLPARREVLTGDTVLGRGTSVVAHPDGDLTDYLASLDVLSAVAADGRWSGLPGHGPVVDDLAAAVSGLRSHRLARVDQVRAALASVAASVAGAARTAGRAPTAGTVDPDPADEELVTAVVRTVYPDLDDPVLVGAASRTVRATLVHLAAARP